jgi:uncharacterized membrane protein
VVTLAAVAFVLTPRSDERRDATASDSGGAQQFARVQAIVAQRCVPCHAARPTQPGFAAPPGNVLLDSSEQIMIRAAQIRQQVATRAMPIGNLTGITEEERATMLAWAEHGAAH